MLKLGAKWQIWNSTNRLFSALGIHQLPNYIEDKAST